MRNTVEFADGWLFPDLSHNVPRVAQMSHPGFIQYVCYPEKDTKCPL